MEDCENCKEKDAEIKELKSIIDERDEHIKEIENLAKQLYNFV